MNFSRRTDWECSENTFAKRLAEGRAQGIDYLDLTGSNIPHCGFPSLSPHALQPLSHPDNTRYNPDPQGLSCARKAAASWFHDRGTPVSHDDIYLTASTSEAYSWCLRLLTNPGDSILVPQPSYPLFRYLGDLNDVTIQHYDWLFDGDWHLDIAGIAAQLNESVKAIIVVSPNNPTGSCLTKSDHDALCKLAAENHLAILSDEVFADYLVDPTCPSPSMASNTQALTFTFGGASKTLGLPQMKIAWMHVSGPTALTRAAKERLDVIADTFLSVNTPSQLALETWMTERHTLINAIQERLARNTDVLMSLAGKDEPTNVYPRAGGWSAVIRTPAEPDEWSTTMALLESEHLIVHPGCFYGFTRGAHLVVSLVTPEAEFEAGIRKIHSWIHARD